MCCVDVSIFAKSIGMGTLLLDVENGIKPQKLRLFSLFFVVFAANEFVTQNISTIFSDT